MFKKLLLTLILFFICSTAHAATTWYLCNGNTNWNGTGWTSIIGDIVGCVAATGSPVAGDTVIMNSTAGNVTVTLTGAAAAASIDETGFTGTLAFGTQTLTLTAASNIGGAMTSTSGTITASSSAGITLLSTATGSFPTLKFTGAVTLTSGGFTWPGAINFAVVGTDTLSGNWVNTGLCTISASTVINHTTSDTLTCNGGLSVTANSGNGSATIILGGGTWSATSYVMNNLTLAGNITVSGDVYFETSTLTYSSGIITVGSGGSGSLLILSTPCTLNTGGMTWNIVNAIGSNTLTLTSNLNSNYLWTDRNTTQTFATAGHVMNIGTLFNQGSTFTQGLIFSAGSVINITAGIHLCQNVSEDINGTSYLISGTANSPIYINYTGTMAEMAICNEIFTDVQATGKTLWDYSYVSQTGVGSYATLTRTLNIKNFNNNNIGGVIAL